MTPQRDLRPYQADGVRRLAGRDTMLLGWEMGLGKTLTAIRAARTLGLSRILVICPAVAREVWRMEFAREGVPMRPHAVLSSFTADVPDTGPVIASYDMLSRDTLVKKILLRHKWDLLICDEAHALKSPTSERTKAVYGPRKDRGEKSLAGRAKRVWLLTGTPAPNHAGEIWTHLHALAPDTIQINNPSRAMNVHEFEDRYCKVRDTAFGRQVTGSKNLPELRDKLGAFMHRLRKDDVAQDLPPLSFDVLPVDPKTAKVPPDLIKQLRDTEHALSEDLRFATAMSTHPGGTPSGNELVAMLAQLKTSAHVATQRRITGQIKAQIAIDMIRQDMAPGESKLIVFAHHREVLATLYAELTEFNPVMIYGDTPQAQRDRAIQLFQSNPKTRIFLGQITAAGTAITLTAASRVLFVEASWVPGDNAQAAARAHRIGQTSPVLAQFLTLVGSMDQMIMTALARKTREIGILIDNQPDVTPEPDTPNTSPSPFQPISAEG